jgi:hypothetical protein
VAFKGTRWRGRGEGGRGLAGCAVWRERERWGQYRQWRENSGRGRQSGGATKVRVKGGPIGMEGAGCVGCHGPAGVSRPESTVKFSIYSK